MTHVYNQVHDLVAWVYAQNIVGVATIVIMFIAGSLASFGLLSIIVDRFEDERLRKSRKNGCKP